MTYIYKYIYISVVYKKLKNMKKKTPDNFQKIENSGKSKGDKPKKKRDIKYVSAKDGETLDELIKRELQK